MSQDKDPMLMNNEEFAEFIKDMQPEYADAWTVMRFESLVNQLMQKFMHPEKRYGKQLLQTCNLTGVMG